MMDDQVEDEVKESRKNAIMEMQQDITFDYMSSLKGNIMKVLIEGYIVEEDIYVGRTYMDAPSIDGLVFVNSDRNHMSGDIIIAEITAADGYDLIANEVY